MGSLPHFEQAFRGVGWFIPPFASMGFLSQLAGKIHGSTLQMSLDQLEVELKALYVPAALAAMVSDRYPKTPVIQDYAKTIAESVEAHMLHLNHVAAAGLVPVIEGAGRTLLARRLGHPVHRQAVRDVFVELAVSCKEQASASDSGGADELTSMMDSFSWFTTNMLFSDSAAPAFLEGTNRHGIAHGAYQDADYGRPLNFYKIIGAVDFLTLVSSLSYGGSLFAPELSAAGVQLLRYYSLLESTASARPHGAA